MKFRKVRSHRNAHDHTPMSRETLEKVIFSPIFIIIWIIFCSILSIRLIDSAISIKQSSMRATQAQEKVHLEEQKGLELIQKMLQADTPLAKEKIMRDELDLQKPGETIIQLPQ